ncbi:hypothetical protein ColLi_10916 [Colletotrichum liriopes]|uniref:Uncharacterized protein n=1 Tax=Colletotrichum liriopes TaxID=708192 RepID=A0AA37LY34_9PEZI|nr:hypothetical protein ColLi_10916 [Colletotrichum liriopes]
MDSLPAATCETELRAKLQVVLVCVGKASDSGNEAQSLDRIRCPEQKNGTDCGIAVIVNGLYAIVGRMVPAKTDYGIWRRVISTFSADTSRRYGPILAWDSIEQLLEVDGVPAPSGPPGRGTMGDFKAWAEQLARYQNSVMMVVRERQAALNIRRRAVIDTVEDIIGLLQTFDLASSGSGDDDDEIGKELATCHSLMNDLAKLRQTEPAMVETLQKRSDRLLDLRRKQLLVLQSFSTLVTTLYDEYEEILKATKA